MDNKEFINKKLYEELNKNFKEFYEELITLCNRRKWDITLIKSEKNYIKKYEVIMDMHKERMVFSWDLVKLGDLVQKYNSLKENITYWVIDMDKKEISFYIEINE